MIKEWSQIILVVVGTIMLTLNIFLLVQNIRLKSALEQSKLLVTETGYRFSELKVRGLDGKEENITFPDPQLQTILLVFNTNCEYCVQQYPYWKELVENVDYNRWRVLAITAEEDYERIKKHIDEYKILNIKVIKVSTLPGEEMRKARLLYTPMTVMLDTEGEVKKVWPGLWKKGFDLPN